MLSVGVIGDYEESFESHPATSRALETAGEALGEPVIVTWLPTQEIRRSVARLAPYDALVASPGSPYRDFDGALSGIRYARETGRPFVGT